MTKIMLVEDDNNLREIYEARLAAEGYDIVAAADGEAALALAGKERPDMIISDVMMPKISGFEMLDILRNTDNLRDVKIIMLTALGQAEDAERANHLGADRYLVKSQVTLEDIVETAHELLNDKEASPLDMTALPTSPATAIDAPTAYEPVFVTTTMAEPETPSVMAMPPAPETAAPDSFDITVAPDPATSMGIPVTEPAPEPIPAAPAAAPASIIIPVTEDTSDDDAAAVTDDTLVYEEADRTADLPIHDDPGIIAVATEPTAEPAAAPEPELHPISNLPVIPEASTDTIQPPQADQTGTAPIDYTSPQNFMKFQAAPVTPEVANLAIETAYTPAMPDDLPAASEMPPTSQADAPQAPIPSQEGQLSSSQEEDVVKAKIDAFISQQGNENPLAAAPIASPTEAQSDSTMETPAINDIPAPPSDYIEPPSDTVQTTIGDPFASTRRTGTPTYATDEPVPEELGNFTDPTIQSNPVQDTASSDDEALVAAALRNFEQGTGASVPSEPTYGGDSTSRNVTPDTSAKPDIDRLLELEAAKNGAQQAASAVNDTDPKPHVDNLMPSAMLGAVVPAPPQTDDDDPNKVAL